MEKIVNIQNIDPNSFQLQNYSVEDESLISNNTQEISFDPTEDYVEYFILDLNQNILYKNTAGFPNYTLINNSVSIDPQKDLEAQGYTEGQYYTIYNFLKRKISSSPDDVFYIQDISTDRTELKLNTTQIINEDVVDLTVEFATQIELASGSYLDFALNFDNNKHVIANNIALDNSNPADPTILIKLYEPLPEEFDIDSQCWIVEQIAESQAYLIELQTIFRLEENLNYIEGPNFNLEIQDQINNSTSYLNLNSLQQNSSLLGSGSLLYQINSLLEEKGIEINVDYTDYSNFIYFSSAQTRLENFYYKLSLIEEYTVSASYTISGTGNIYTSGSYTFWQNQINNIITNFDGYEYYLYYESGSYAWPKTNTEYPYINESVSSLVALAWLSGMLDSASIYDKNNSNALIYARPNYISDDPDNNNYLLFTQMLGQHFDNIWIYLKDITNKFDADNRLEYGISKDIVAQAIRDLGIKIYQNNFSTDNLYSALLGITPSGSLFNVPYVTSSLPTPLGFEYVNTFITASSTSSIQPLDDVNKEIYKRIYHNTPKLLKKKGSAEGLRMLVNLYGIPDTILRINEFGGKSYQDSSWDNYANQFNYALKVDNGGRVIFRIDQPNFGATYYPTTLQFRFKTSGIKPGAGTSPYGEILFATNNNQHHILLRYTGSRYDSSSLYDGSIPDPYNEFADLIYYNGSSTAIIPGLPFYDGGWWSVMLTSDGTNNTLYAGNKTYSYDEGSTIGYIGSASTGGPLFNNTYQIAFLSKAGNFTLAPITYTPFSGSFQELRLYSFNNDIICLNSNSFFDYIMNPYSIEGNKLSGSESTRNSLFFRAPLGSMLDNSGSGLQTRGSIHPSIFTIPATQSFNATNTSSYSLNGTYIFEPNVETIFQDQFVAGVKNAVSEKIRIVNSTVPYGKILSQYRSVQQPPPYSTSYTKDINYIEAAFSPQDEVNDDIIAQLGSFNIGNYIGDPRHLLSLTTSGSLTYYPDFNKIRDEYFSKYTISGSYYGGYDLNDYIRLIKFYDNSLFKMIKDFTPAKAGLASGIVIKQTMLERCRYPQPRVNTNSTIAFVGNPTSSTLNIPY